ncbi:50S ribosomal protein L3 [Desulfurococcaceae archaeon MEX13E-LK6-19]|nr:50S ribosomal protein L3 [Desulfurococcaceae archaeon MEX13E-LK6-19]
MGHRKHSAPRHGSLGVRPRKRAADIVPRVRSWPEVVSEQPLLLGFAAYKAGMTHAIVIDDRPDSYTSGKEIFMPLTVLETPPMIVLAVRGYRYDTTYGYRTIGEVWRSPIEALENIANKFATSPFIKKEPKDIVRGYLKGLRKRLPSLVKPDEASEYKYKFLEKNWEQQLEKLFSEKVDDVRVILSTVPIISGVGKKKPELIEVKIGGGKDISERIEYAKKILGTYITVFDVFKPGQFVDVIGVTKGKGFQGVIKRFGVKELPRWHKHRKGSRKIGSRSPGFGTVSTTPQPGQMGFHRRTEYNKRIIMMGENGIEVTPAGGFIGYGIVKTHYIALQGSVIGPRKRLIVLRHPIRAPAWTPESTPKIVYLSLTSKQGV